MAVPTLLLTELDAVNTMLASIGQTPVNSLAVTGIRDVAIAQLALQNTTREVLNRGWNFNTDQCYDLAMNGSGEIELPSEVLDLDPTDRYQKFVMRDDSGTIKLWDKVNHTFTLSTYHTSPVEVNITWAYEFDEIPNVLRNYIAIRAARIFQAQVLASDILFKFTSLMEQEAYADALKLEARSKDRNWFTSGADINKIVNRHRNVSRWG